jgi:hypothetical protein
MGSDIVIVSGHYPSTVKYVQLTKKTVENYCNLHGYFFYYEDTPPVETELHHLQYNRCEILRRAHLKYPESTWFIWLDSDVFVNRVDIRIETVIDLSDTNILYHLFHEKPWSFDINAGVKIVNKDAIKIESEIFEYRNEDEWKKFPYEQRVMCEKIIPKYKDRILIHDPYVLNCIEQNYKIRDSLKLYRIDEAIFVHLAGRSEEFRNKFMGILLTEKELSDKPLINNDEYIDIVRQTDATYNYFF